MQLNHVRSHPQLLSVRISRNEKEIIEILPPESFHNHKFSTYNDVVLDFKDLKDIIKSRSKFKDWHLMLSAVKGIYLILDKKTGDQYIGSAYGDSLLRSWQ